jgi:hypothetical protein
VDQGHQVTLQEQSQNWKTPKANDVNGNGYSYEPNGDVVLNLGGEATQWQSPATGSFRSRGLDRKDEMGLDQQERMWPTPDGNAAERINQSPSEGAAERPTLGLFAKTWPSPRSEDGESCGNHPEATDRASLPDPTIQDGPPSSTPTPNLPRFSWLMAQPQKNRRLNPRFAAWLMGWDPLWATVSINSGASEME